LQPLPAPRRTIWQIASYFLIAGGLILLGWGGWIFYQNQLEASQPPPARIVEVSLDDLETPTVRPLPTATEPAAARQQPTGDTLVLTPTDVPEPDLDLSPEPTATDATVEETPATEPTPPPAEPTADDVLSLADNPLVVDRPEETGPAEVEPVIDQPVAALPSPLTQIVAESIDMDAPVVGVGWQEVVHNGQTVNIWDVAEYAAGWHKNSMLPGQGGNIVLSGHHNIKGEVFRYIVDLEPGAIISVYMDGQRYDYAVADKFIVKDKGEPDEVRRANARWIGPFNEERLTLVTCWPYNNNTHRVIVIAKPV
jgi:sortase A